MTAGTFLRRRASATVPTSSFGQSHRVTAGAVVGQVNEFLFGLHALKPGGSLYFACVGKLGEVLLYRPQCFGEV